MVPALIIICVRRVLPLAFRIFSLTTSGQRPDSPTALGTLSSNLLMIHSATNGGSPRTSYGYTGRERDPLTTLLYYRARFYDPQLGRFLSEDPIGLESDIDLYAYVSNSPLNYSDPLGLQSVPNKAKSARPAPGSGCDPCNDPSNWDTRLSDARQIASSLGHRRQPILLTTMPATSRRISIRAARTATTPLTA